MLQTNWIWRSSPVRPFSLLPRQHNVSRQVRRPGGRTSLAPTNTTKRIKRRKKKEKSQREKKKKKSETSVLYDTWRVEAYHSTTLWAPFLIKGGPLTPRWEFSWKVGGRHGASDGPLAFAYHQLPPLILHPPRSNCDGQHSWHITHVWFIDGHETSRAIALCTQAGRQERDYTPAAPIFQSNFSIPRIFFFSSCEKKRRKSSINLLEISRRKSVLTIIPRVLPPPVTESICNGRLLQTRGECWSLLIYISNIYHFHSWPLKTLGGKWGGLQKNKTLHTRWISTVI